VRSIARVTPSWSGSGSATSVIGVVQVAARPAGGGFTPLGNVSDTSSDDEAPAVAADRAGDAVAVWQRDH
jgi:hypothetical protein